MAPRRIYWAVYCDAQTCVVKSMTVLVHEDKIKTGDCPVVGCKDRKGEEIFFHLYTTHSTVNGADITWLKVSTSGATYRSEAFES